MTQIRFHVEGGVSKNQDTDMREAFGEFFRELDKAVRSQGNSIRFVLHGSRRIAYEKFRHALTEAPGEYHVLLVDSEAPVARWGTCWEHLRGRDGDKWVRPTGTDEEQCQLMVETIEGWFFADSATLQTYYGKKFNDNLPKRLNVEQIPKSEHIAKLKAATRHTPKGVYHKTNHLPGILWALRAVEVRKRAWHCDRIFVTLSAKFGDAMAPLCTLQPEP